MRRTDSSACAAAAVTVLALSAVLLTGCGPSPQPGPGTSSAPRVTASPTPSGPVLAPDGTAEDNLPLFTSVMNAVAATDARAQGRAYIDALVAAGFPKDAMEVTRDLTSVGNPADSIQFSVRWDDECIVGQVGPSTPAPTALVLPLTPAGTCLIGLTRPIDW